MSKSSSPTAKILHWSNAKISAAVLAVISLVTAIIYWPTLIYGFVFDDLPTILHYPHIKNIDFKSQFFGNARWVSRLLNQVSFHFSQTSPFGYRIVDLLMHLVIGSMIFYLVQKLCQLTQQKFLQDNTLWISGLTTTLFFLHPVQTQTVTYITQMRLEGLVALFTMPIMLTFLQGVTTDNKKTGNLWLYGSFALTAVATGTKEIIVALPFLILATDWFFVARTDLNDLKKRWWVHAVYFAIVFLLLAKYGVTKPSSIIGLASSQLHNHRGNILNGNINTPITFFPFFISQGKVILHYLSMFFWPVNLSFDYDIRLSNSIFDLDVILPYALLALMVGLVVRATLRKQAPFICFGITWFLLATLPRASVFPSTELVCDYKTYLASFGIMLLIASTLVYACDWLYHKLIQTTPQLTRTSLFATIMIISIFGLGIATKQRNYVWSSELAFWEDVVNKSPEKARGYNNYATALWEKGEADKAFAAFHKSIQLDENYGEPHVNLAALYQTYGDREKALKHYERALEIGEGHPELFCNLGLLHYSDRNFDVAQMCFQQAIDIRPAFSKAHTWMGKIQQELNNKTQALAYFEKAVHGDSADIEDFYLCGQHTLELGDADKALTYLSMIDPSYQQTNFLLGCCYYQQNNYEKSCALFAQAYASNQNDANIAYNYAQALLHAHHYQEALPLFDQCLRSGLAVAYVPLHMARCLFELGEKDAAKTTVNTLIAQASDPDVRNEAKALKKEFGMA